VSDISMRERPTRTCLLLALALPFVAGAQQGAQQMAKVSVQSDDTMPDFVRRAAIAHPQPGDRVWFHVWREPKLSDTVMVDERGDVMLPKIGIVNAAALTIGAFRDTVRARIAEFLRDSPIELVVLRRVAVNGEVAKPNVYYVDVTTTVRDVIARAGGVTDLGNADNVGAIFRNAAAFGADAVLLGPDCADPLYRKAIRTSMAAALSVPFAQAVPWPGALHELRGSGMRVVGLSPSAGAPSIRDVAATLDGDVAVIAGHEGDGLTPDAMSACDTLARIPMAAGVDSVNVGVAVGIALYELAAAGTAEGTV
jgi:tRNA(Leu) C34 or U34 (ribose-2'-O)-methylase TrmL